MRSSNKSHGRQNKIEGYYNEGQSVILIEDLISSGKSSLEAVEELKSKNLSIKGVVSILTMDFQNQKKILKNMNVNIYRYDYQFFYRRPLKVTT